MDAGGANYASFFTRRDRSVWYGPVVAATAALLLLLLAWPRTAPVCSLQAEVTLAPFDAQHAAAVPEVTDVEWSLLCKIPQQSSTDNGPHIAATQRDGSYHVRLVWMTDRPSHDAADLQQYVHSLIQRGPAYIMSRNAALKNKAEVIREREAWDQLELRLKSFVESARTLADEQLAAIRGRQQLQSFVPVSTDAVSSNELSQLQTLQLLLKAEQERLTELRLTRTEQHPDVVRQRSRVAVLGEQLQSASVTAPSLDPALDAKAALQQIRADDEQILERLRASSDLLADAEHELHAALTSYLHVRTDTGRRLDAPVSWQAKVTRPPQIVERSGGLGREQLGLSLLTATLVGLLSIRRRDDVLRSVEQLQQEWGGRAVAIIGSGDSPRGRASEGRAGTGGRGGIRLAEVILLTAAGLLVMSMLADRSFLAHLIHDPWLALRETWLL